MDEEEIEKIIILRGSALFKALPSEVLYAISQIANWVEAFSGELLFRCGDEGTGLYIIASGKVVISRDHMKERILEEYDYFGEIALLSRGPRVATATAKSECNLLFIDRRYFEDLVFDFPEMLITLIDGLIGYIRSQSLLPSQYQKDD